MDGKIRLALFDFDGTLTRRDTFLEFIRFCFGSGRLYAGLLLFSPLLILMKLRLYPNGKAKQQVFSHFFQGMDEHRFEAYCSDFCRLRLPALLRPEMLREVDRQRVRNPRRTTYRPFPHAQLLRSRESPPPPRHLSPPLHLLCGGVWRQPGG